MPSPQNPSAPPSDAPGFELSVEAQASVSRRRFGMYIHVPFCATRCGYCDFNTYTPGELGTASSPASWLEGMRQECDAAAKALGSSPLIDTIFVGGGTPSLLGADGLKSVLDGVTNSFDLAPNAEITTEANPESTSRDFFADIREAGYTRVSLGMQSASPHVLRILDRTHTAGRPVAAVKEAKDAGFEHINLDLIYGTPGERTEDLQASLDAVCSAGVDHVSAYALIVEDGTAFARKVRKGEVSAPDDDVLAADYELVDDALSAAGLRWYEVSNWAADDAARCHHNMGYWQGENWWGIGPGAHSHVGGVRWWNVKHPAKYTTMLNDGVLPVDGSETLSQDDIHTERVMLELRLSDGMSVDFLSPTGLRAARQAASEGFLRQDVLERDGRAVLTRPGRLLADGIVRRLLA